MKKLMLLLFFVPMLAGAQSLVGGKNIFRWNIGSVALRNYHFTYERSLSKHFSASLSYRTMAKGSLPFQDRLASIIDSKSVNFGNFQIGGTAWTLEGRFYLGLGRMKGFYIAPYLRWASFDISAPVKYTYTSTTPPTAGQSFSKEANFSGKMKSTSPGLLLGWQFQLATKVVLDLQIIGGHYGKGTGDLGFATPLNNDEVNALNSSINDIIKNSGPYKLTGSANNSGAQIKADGPWFGVRSNIGIGIRF
jgi:hypothetical protein